MGAYFIVLSLLGVAAQDASEWSAIRQQALTHRLEGRAPEAVALLEAAAKRWPADGDVQYELGDTLFDAARNIGEPGSPERTAALERAARHLRQAMTLAGSAQPLAAVKFVMINDEDGLARPADVEVAARLLTEWDPSSSTWAIKLAHSQATQGRCAEAARTLVAHRPTVAHDTRLLLGMSMTELAVRCDALPPADARPLFQAALDLAHEVLAETPDERDATMLQTGAAMMLAPLVDDAAERARLEALSSSAFDRFMEQNPERQRALAGEPPENLYNLFAWLGEFEREGRRDEARRLLERAEVVHAASAEFWRQAAFHHYMNEHVDEGLTAIDRALALSPGDAPNLMLKVTLLEEKAEAATDDATRKQLTDEAARWRTRAEAAMPPPPPPPPPPRP